MAWLREAGWARSRGQCRGWQCPEPVRPTRTYGFGALLTVLSALVGDNDVADARDEWQGAADLEEEQPAVEAAALPKPDPKDAFVDFGVSESNAPARCSALQDQVDGGEGEEGEGEIVLEPPDVADLAAFAPVVAAAAAAAAAPAAAAATAAPAAPLLADSALNTTTPLANPLAAAAPPAELPETPVASQPVVAPPDAPAAVDDATPRHAAATPLAPAAVMTPAAAGRRDTRAARSAAPSAAALQQLASSSSVSNDSSDSSDSDDDEAVPATGCPAVGSLIKSRGVFGSILEGNKVQWEAASGNTVESARLVGPGARPSC